MRLTEPVLLPIEYWHACLKLDSGFWSPVAAEGALVREAWTFLVLDICEFLQCWIQGFVGGTLDSSFGSSPWFSRLDKQPPRKIFICRGTICLDHRFFDFKNRRRKLSKRTKPGKMKNGCWSYWCSFYENANQRHLSICTAGLQT